MNLGRSCCGINGNFDEVNDCANHTQLYSMLSVSPVNSVLTTLGVDLGNDGTHVSFTAAPSTPSPRNGLLSDLLLDDSIFLIISRRIVS